MAKLPYMPFFPADYLRDTRCLSLAARGAWMDILCALWNSPKRGRRTLSLEGWAGEIGKASSEVSLVLHELEACEIGNISRENDTQITIISRRMVRDERIRKLAAKRKQKQRDNSESRSESRESHADVTGIYQKSDIRYQKSELREEKIGIVVNGSRPKATRGSIYPDGFEPDERAQMLAVSTGLNPHKELAAFRDHHTAKGTVFKDWQAAFRNWLRNALKYNQRGARA